MMVKTPQGVQWFGSLIYFPLTFGSNVLVPSQKMPGWLQAFVKVNPMTSVTEAVRGLFIGGPVATPAIRSLLWAAGIFAVFAPPFLARLSINRRQADRRRQQRVAGLENDPDL